LRKGGHHRRDQRCAKRAMQQKVVVFSTVALTEAATEQRFEISLSAWRL